MKYTAHTWGEGRERVCVCKLVKSRNPPDRKVLELILLQF